MTIQQLGMQAQAASRTLAVSSGAQRDAALAAMAEALAQGAVSILAANAVDMQAAR